MNDMKKPICAKFKVIGHTGLFLNMLMIKVDEFNVQISISIKRKPISLKEIELNINYINLNGKYDNEIIMELNDL